LSEIFPLCFGAGELPASHIVDGIAEVVGNRDVLIGIVAMFCSFESAVFLANTPLGGSIAWMFAVAHISGLGFNFYHVLNIVGAVITICNTVITVGCRCS
jgi:hypothetical protein